MPRLSAFSAETPINITRLSTPAQPIGVTARVQDTSAPVAEDAQPIVTADPPSDAETLPLPKDYLEP